MRTIAVTSGKGGVGKTNISANLAISIAAKANNVVVFDGDIGLANLDVVLGTRTQSTLQHVFSGEKTLTDVIQAGPGGIRFIPGGSGVETLCSLTDDLTEMITREFAALETATDYLIIDTGAGIDGNVLAFINAADEVLIVVTPDPASMTDGYAIAKALFAQNPNAVVGLIFNMVADEAEAQNLFAKMAAIVQQFLGAKLSFAGFVRYDPGAVAMIRRRTPFVLGDPKLRASVDVERLARKIVGQSPAKSQDDLLSRLRSVFGLRVQKAA